MASRLIDSRTKYLLTTGIGITAVCSMRRNAARPPPESPLAVTRVANLSMPVLSTTCSDWPVGSPWQCAVLALGISGQCPESAPDANLAWQCAGPVVIVTCKYTANFSKMTGAGLAAHAVR